MKLYLSFLIHLPLLTMLLFYNYRQQKHSPLAIHFFPSALIKLVAGVALGGIYLFYYRIAGDTFDMHKASVALTDILFSDFQQYLDVFFTGNYTEQTKNAIGYWDQPRVMFFVKILSLINIFTFSVYWVNALYLSLFSFAGAWVLANTLVRYYSVSKISVTVAFLYFPSMVFWSSGLLKETIAIGAMTFFIAISIKALKQQHIRWYQILYLLLLAFIIFKIKFYYLAVLVPVVVAYAASYTIAWRWSIPAWHQVLLFLCVFILLSLLFTTVHPLLSLDSLAHSLYENYLATLKYSHGKNTFELEGLQPNFKSILVHVPEALLTGLFRPSFFDVGNILGFMAALENMLLALLAAVALFSLSIRSKPAYLLEIFVLIIYIVVLSVLLAIASPNFGTLLRYKVSYSPFFLLLLLQSRGFEKIRSRISGMMNSRK